MEENESVEINGAKMDRTYFEANVKDAKSVKWNRAVIPLDVDHRHCIICEFAMSAGTQSFRSSTGWLCESCFVKYVESGQ
jgi:hypothetical protein